VPYLTEGIHLRPQAIRELYRRPDEEASA